VRANDGYNQPNKFFLRKVYGAQGLLIDPHIITSKNCWVIGTEAIFFWCALVKDYYGQGYEELLYANLMTVAIETQNSDLGHNAQDHFEYGTRFIQRGFAVRHVPFSARATTLTKKLALVEAPTDIG